MKIDSIPRGSSFSFIGNLSSFSESMNALFPDQKLPPDNHNALDSKCKTIILRKFKMGEKEIIRICNFLKADFVCFGYPIPRECTKNGTQTSA
jgi:hypothetical protein